MKHHRLTPSALVAAVALVGAGCTATTLESAAAPDTQTRVLADSPAPTAPPAPTVPATQSGRSAAGSPVTTSSSPRIATPSSVSTTSTTSTTTQPSTTVPASIGESPVVAPIVVSPTLRPDPVVTIAPVLTLDPCGAPGPMPDQATAITSIDVDADGDGAVDTATSYLDGGSGTWAIRLAMASGTLSEYEVADVAPGFVEALGSIPFGDGPDESFLAIVGSGASAFRIGLFGADDSGCITRHGGDDLDLAVGGSIGGLTGLRCGAWDGGHYLESLSAVNNGDDTYNVYGTTWHLDADGELFAENGTHLFGASFDDVESIASIDCEGIDL